MSLPDEFTITLTLKRSEGLGGLHQEWVGAERSDEDRIELSCGAGLGNPQGYVRVRRAGEDARFVFDARDIIYAVDKRLEETP